MTTPRARAQQEAQLFEILHHGVFGLTREEHAAVKHMPAGQDLDDYLTAEELRFLNRAMQVCEQLHQTRDTQGFPGLCDDALDAARQVHAELLNYEQEMGRPVLTAENDFSLRGLRHPGMRGVVPE